MIVDVLNHFLPKFYQMSIDLNGSLSPNMLNLLHQVPDQVIVEQPMSVQNDAYLSDCVAQLPHSIVLDESVRTMADLDRISGLGVGVMLKPVCCGGPTPFINMVNRCVQLDIDCGISGYLESGVGRWFQWLLAQVSGLTLSPDFVWSNYYFLNDVVSVLPESNFINDGVNLDACDVIETIQFDG